MADPRLKNLDDALPPRVVLYLKQHPGAITLIDEVALREGEGREWIGEPLPHDPARQFMAVVSKLDKSWRDQGQPRTPSADVFIRWLDGLTYADLERLKTAGAVVKE